MHPILRVLSGIGAVVVFLVGLALSFGAILGAPLGIWLVRRRSRRYDRQPNRVAELMGAALASSLFAALLWSVIFMLAPRPTRQELQSAVARSQSRPAVKLPEWYTKAFPSAARSDSAAETAMQSPEFMRTTLVLGAVVMSLFFGLLGGALGWGASSLLRLASYGGRVPQ